MAGLGGLALGYVLDQAFGDGNYTPKEMFISTGTSMIGGGLLRPVGTAASRGYKVARNFGDDAYKVGVSVYDDIAIAAYTLGPLVSKPVRREVIGGIVLGFVYEFISQSSGSSSEQNGTHVGPGGTSSGKKLDSRFSYVVKNQYDRRGYRDGLRGPCKKGYVLHRATNGVWHCVKK